MKAMLLAAGRGVRMAGLHSDLPKPLLSIGDATLIERQITLLRAAGIHSLVINLSYRGKRIRQHLGTGHELGVEIEYSEEGEPPLETAGGILAALPLLGTGPFLVVNSDLVTDFDYRQLASLAGRHAGGPAGLLGTLVLVPNPPHHPEGDYALDAHGRATHGGARLTYAGISVLHPDLFAGLAPGRSTLRPLFDAAVDSGRLAAIRHDGLWIDVGTPERLEQARSVMRNASGGALRR